MKYKYLLLLLLLFFLNCVNNTQSTSKQAINGVINLSDWDFQKQGFVSMEGQWEFFWNQFLYPNEPIDNHFENRTAYLAPGDVWSDQENKGLNLNGTGYATYKLKIIFPSKYIDKIFGIKFKTTGGAAYKVFIEDQIVLELGKVGKDRESMEPTRKADNVYFTLKKTEINLVIQISNFYHADGAFWYSPILGESSQINFASRRKQLFDATLFGTIFIMALYHISIFIHRRKDKASLFFGLFCLCVSIYILSVNEVFIYYFFPEIPFYLAHRLSNIYFLGVPFYLGFLCYVFPSEMSLRKLKWIGLIFSILYLFIFFTPPEIGTKLQRPGTIMLMLGFLYAFWVVLRATLNRRTDSILIFIPNCIFVFSVVNEILTIYNVVNTEMLVSHSIFIFIIAQSILLSRRFMNAFKDVKILSQELQEINNNLEETVSKRTIQFKIQKQRAEEANAWKDKFISLVSHDLRAPLGGVYGLLDIVENDRDISDKEKNEIVSRLKTTIFNTISVVKHLLSLSKFQNSTVKLNYKNMKLDAYFKYLFDEFSLEVERKKINLVNLIPANTILTVDVDICYEIFRNFISNAIKFSKENGNITIEYYENEKFQIITIADNGVGMSEFTRNNLFIKEVSTKGTAGEKGFGVGLKLCNDLIKLHSGFIKVESKEGFGTKFELYFPQNKNPIFIVGELETGLKEILIHDGYLPIVLEDLDSSIKILEDIQSKLILILEKYPRVRMENFLREIQLNKLNSNIRVILVNYDYAISHEHITSIHTSGNNFGFLEKILTQK